MMSGIRWSLVAAMLLVLPVGCGDAPTGRRVVVYVSADEQIAREVLDAFELATGIDVLMIGDSEASKTTGLVQRLRAEHDAPVADVFWSSEAMQTIELANEGLFAECPDVIWPRAHRDEGGRWFAFSPRPRVIVFDPKRLAEADRPRSWSSAVDGTFTDRLVMADPRFGTTGGHLAAMATAWSDRETPERFDEFLEGLRRSRVRLLPGGNAAVVEQVASGEADIGFTDADDVRAAQARGMRVEMIYPRHHDGAGGGTFLMPNTVAVVEGSPRHAEAMALVEFLLSDDTAQRLAASSSGNVPLQPSVAEAFPDLVVDDPLEVDLAAASGVGPEVIRRTVETLRDAERRP